MPRIRVFTKNGIHSHYLTPKWAELMVSCGKAEKIGDRSIRELHNRIPESARIKHHPIACGQGEIYTALAIETHPAIFNGGLTRTETQPQNHQPFKGARVGSQK